MLPYIGGKSRISTFIKHFIPSDIETYVEPFSGMYWLFLKMDLSNYENLKKVVYNDVNPLNVNLFRCIKDYDKLWNLSKNIPIEDPELFKQFQSEIFNSDLDLNSPNFEVAYKYAYVLSQVWSGKDPTKAVLVKNGGYVSKKTGIYVSKFEIFRNKLIDPSFQKYIDCITDIENLDFEEVIKKYDSPKTYFYCDPPYYLTEKYYANHDFNRDTHERLADTLKNIKGRFSLSYYHFDLLYEWFPKNKFRWESKVFSKSAMAKSGEAQTKGTELLILNY
jgi:DNA adenine methylase